MLRVCLLAFALLLPGTALAQPKEKEKAQLTDADKKQLEETKENAKAAAGFLGMGFVMFAAMCVGAIAFSLIPAVVAFGRGHPNALPITVVSLFFGWTCIGWVACLAWSLTAVETCSMLTRPARKVNTSPSPSCRAWARRSLTLASSPRCPCGCTPSSRSDTSSARSKIPSRS
ncbi:hypothetical protein B7486_65620, partial [cyanobacterium TDX16]